MSLHPYKFLVQPIVQERDSDGNVIADGPLLNGQTSEPIVEEIFGCDALAKWAAEFPKLLADKQPSGE